MSYFLKLLSMAIFSVRFAVLKGLRKHLSNFAVLLGAQNIVMFTCNFTILNINISKIAIMTKC